MRSGWPRPRPGRPQPRRHPHIHPQAGGAHSCASHQPSPTPGLRPGNFGERHWGILASGAIPRRQRQRRTGEWGIVLPSLPGANNIATEAFASASGGSATSAAMPPPSLAANGTKRSASTRPSSVERSRSFPVSTGSTRSSRRPEGWGASTSCDGSPDSAAWQPASPPVSAVTGNTTSSLSGDGEQRITQPQQQPTLLDQ